MDDALNIPRIATLLADPARARILWTLIDGTTRPAGELAFAANVSAQSASAHLAKLVEGGLLLGEAHGRHRYFRIASTQAAELIESMASFGATARPRTPRSPPLARAMPNQFLHARTCFDHLAGATAVEILGAMLKQRWLVGSGTDFKATRLGREKLAELGIDLAELHSARRTFARGCVDLTQRRPHLAGALGAALLKLLVRKDWILLSPRSRVVQITPKGHAGLKRALDISTQSIG